MSDLTINPSSKIEWPSSSCSNPGVSGVAATESFDTLQDSPTQITAKKCEFGPDGNIHLEEEQMQNLSVVPAEGGRVSNTLSTNEAAEIRSPIIDKLTVIEPIPNEPVHLSHQLCQSIDVNNNNCDAENVPVVSNNLTENNPSDLAIISTGTQIKVNPQLATSISDSSAESFSSCTLLSRDLQSPTNKNSNVIACSNESKVESSQESSISKSVTSKTIVPTSPTQAHLCNLCGKQYRHGASLRNHVRKHESGFLASKRYPCPYCAYSSQYNRNVVKHIETTHCNLENAIHLRTNLQAVYPSKSNTSFKEGLPHKIASPEWKSRNTKDTALYNAITNDATLCKPQEHQSFLPGRRNTDSIRNQYGSFYRPRWPVTEVQPARRGVSDPTPYSEYNYNQPDMTDVFMGSPNKRNSLQDLLSPERSEVLPHVNRSNKRPPEIGFNDVRQFPDSLRHLVSKKQQVDCQPNSSVGSNVKANFYHQGGFTSSSGSGAPDIYCFPGSSNNYRAPVGMEANAGYSGMTDQMGSDSQGFPATGTVAPSDGSNFPVATSSDTGYQNFEPIVSSQPYSYIFHPGSEESQANKIDRTVANVERTRVNVPQPRTDTGFGSLASDKSGRQGGCFEPQVNSVEKLLCASECSTDGLGGAANGEPDDIWPSCEHALAESDVVEQSSSFSHTSDDFSELRCAMSEKGQCSSDFSIKADDGYIQHELTSEADAFFSDLEEILAREVPLFDRSTPQQPNSDLVGIKADGIARSSPQCTMGKLFNTASMMSGDSGLESWSSSSSCSTGANGSSGWGSQETVTQLKSSPSASSSQQATGFAPIGTQDPCSAADQPFDDLHAIRGINESEFRAASSHLLEHSVEDRSATSVKFSTSSLSPSCEQNNFLQTKSSGTMERGSVRDNSIVPPHEDYLGTRLTHSSYKSDDPGQVALFNRAGYDHQSLSNQTSYTNTQASVTSDYFNINKDRRYAASFYECARLEPNAGLTARPTERFPSVHMGNLARSEPCTHSTSCPPYRFPPNTVKLSDDSLGDYQLAHETNAALMRPDFKRRPAGPSTFNQQVNQAGGTHLLAHDPNFPHPMSGGGYSSHPNGFVCSQVTGADPAESGVASRLETTQPQFQPGYGGWFVNHSGVNGSGASLHAPPPPGAGGMPISERGYISAPSTAPSRAFWAMDSACPTGGYPSAYPLHNNHHPQAYRTYYNMHSYEGGMYPAPSSFPVEQMSFQSQRYSRPESEQPNNPYRSTVMPNSSVSATGMMTSLQHQHPSPASAAYLRRGQVSSPRQMQPHSHNYAMPACATGAPAMYYRNPDAIQAPQSYQTPVNTYTDWQTGEATGFGPTAIPHGTADSYGQDAMHIMQTANSSRHMDSGGSSMPTVLAHTPHHSSRVVDAGPSADPAVRPPNASSFVPCEPGSTTSSYRHMPSSTFQQQQQQQQQPPPPQQQSSSNEWAQSQVTESGDGTGPYRNYQLSTIS